MKELPPGLGDGGSGPIAAVFDLGHPAQFHLFKHTIAALKDGGHRVCLVARQKDCLPELLEDAGWPFHLVPRRGTHALALAVEQLRAFRAVLRLARRCRAELLVGTSVVVGPAARLTGATSVVFCEDDAQAVPLFARLAYPAAHYVVTPQCLAGQVGRARHLTYRGFEELAYLHPNRYRPDEGVRRLLGLRAGEKYFVIRLVAMKAHHDVGQKGLSQDQVRQLLMRLRSRGRVFISAEGDVPADLQPYLLRVPVRRIFDVLAFAEMFVGDGQTMTAEAALLGTPALRCNTFVGRLTVLEELEHRWGLTVGIRPDEFARVLAQVDDWLARPDLKARWQRKRQAVLADCVDLTGWILDLLAHLARGTAPPEPDRPGSRAP